MPKICYSSKKFSEDKLSLIEKLDQICQSYARQGYNMTLRQVYYQVVTRDYFPDDRRWTQIDGKWIRDINGKKNADPNYKWLGEIVADARMAGLIDWDHIVDRVRNLVVNSHWEKPSDLIEDAAPQYAVDKWATQANYVEVHIEKDALAGVIEPKCAELDVPFFACRGYVSASAMWGAAQRLLGKISEGKTIHIIHLGDHDPSGIDMSRDIKERLDAFISAHDGGKIHVLRVALNMPQIKRLSLPPDPAKVDDPRAGDYIRVYGEESWELDALDPRELNTIVERAVKQYRDEGLWEEAVKIENRGKKTLQTIHEQFGDVVRFLRGEIV